MMSAGHVDPGPLLDRRRGTTRPAWTDGALELFCGALAVLGKHQAAGSKPPGNNDANHLQCPASVTEPGIVARHLAA